MRYDGKFVLSGCNDPKHITKVPQLLVGLVGWLVFVCVVCLFVCVFEHLSSANKLVPDICGFVLVAPKYI